MWVVSNDKTYPIFINYLNFDRATFTLRPNPQLLYINMVLQYKKVGPWRDYSSGNGCTSS